jgi:GntR family transcriptional regulator / MocR family aminotransferase
MLGIELSGQAGQPLKRRLYESLKGLITNGLLKSGEALPSTRELAQALNISRSTVCEAYEMLLAEGYLLSRRGAATVVAGSLYIESLPDVISHEAEHNRTFAADFRTGSPDLDLFPRFLWQQMMRRAMEELPLSKYGYSGPQGLEELRSEIAGWLYRSRGLLLHPDDIFITAGATHALHLTADLLYENGRALLAEDPCHSGMLETYLNKGCPVVPVPVDEQGIRTDLLPMGGNAFAVYVTPSHQFPLGGILPAARRAALIRYAREKELYIIEDDYDSEFRYCGEPVAPLYALDPQRVIYVGTFSKTLFPALRIGFVLLPRILQKRWRKLRTHTDVQNPVFEQAALAMLLRTRKLDRHIQKMRRVYSQRRHALLDALTVSFGSGFIPWGDAAGLHLAVQFPGMRFDDAFHRACQNQSIYVTTVDRHCIQKGSHTDKLLLGYGHLTPEKIRSGIPLLVKAMREVTEEYEK